MMTKLGLLTIGLLLFAVCQISAKPVQAEDELNSVMRMRRSPVPKRRGKLRSQEDSSSSESNSSSSSEEDGVDTDYDDDVNDNGVDTDDDDDDNDYGVNTDYDDDDDDDNDNGVDTDYEDDDDDDGVYTDYDDDDDDGVYTEYDDDDTDISVEIFTSPAARLNRGNRRPRGRRGRIIRV